MAMKLSLPSFAMQKSLPQALMREVLASLFCLKTPRVFPVERY
jgi:hypothetical protein